MFARGGHCNWKVFFAKYRKVIKTQYYLFNGCDRNGRYFQILKIPIEISEVCHQSDFNKYLLKVKKENQP